MSQTLVIGANRGIGYEIAKQLARRGDAVIATSRAAAPALAAIDGVDVRVGVDVTAKATLDGLAASLGPKSVDTLWLVAGVLRRSSLDSFDADVVRQQFEVNALGPLQAVAALSGSLRDGGKIALLTSRMGSIADNTSGSSYGYRMSKAALNMAGASLAHDLRGREISVVLLHPGYVRTEMTGGTGHIDADEAARGLIARVDELKLETTGRFVHQSGEALPW